MSSGESRYAEVNGTRLYYETAGAGHPLVLIHGYTDEQLQSPEMIAAVKAAIQEE